MTVYSGEDRRKPDERIIVLETKLEEMEKTLEAVKNTVEEMSKKLSQGKGFIGGVVFVISCLWAFVGLAKDWFISGK